jgi:hypothetical protein
LGSLRRHTPALAQASTDIVLSLFFAAFRNISSASLALPCPQRKMPKLFSVTESSLLMLSASR